MPKKKELSNAQRFINAYNNIDHALKTRYSMSRSVGFSELVRKTVAMNYIVRKNEDELIDYGRLRNAIIHNNNDTIIIAEPHDSVVENIERIERLLTTPPKALDSVGQRNVLTIDSASCMRDVIKLIASSSFSNIPVYKNDELIGIANGQKILDAFGQFLISGGKSEVFLNNVQIADMLSSLENNNYYTVVDANFTVEQALNEFHNNPKLLAILITKTGSARELPLGIMTGADVINMNKVLELY